MSIAALALRVCTVLALRGVTLAKGAVYDSPVSPDTLAARAATPSIFVYSDMEHSEGMGTRDLVSADRTVELSLLIVLPPEFKATIGEQTITFQDGKAGAALAIDLIYRQVERALVGEDTVWSRLWVELVARIASVTSHAYVLPVGEGATQRKLPARVFSFLVEPLNSPPFGVAPAGLWADVLAALATTPDYAVLGALIADAIEGEALPQWRVDALDVGDTIADAEQLGEAPLGGGPRDAEVPMAEVDVLGLSADGAGGAVRVVP